MKEQTILEMKNKIEVLGKNVQGLIAQNGHLTELAIGTLETIKLMPGYEESIQQLKEQAMEQDRKDAGGEKKFEPLG